jgi:hypothetical protein
MLTIRKEQIAAFTASMRGSFEDRMVVCLREDYPADCETLGEAQTRRVIDLGIGRAAAHGFDTKGDVRDYICLMFRLGSYFDEDPFFPWVAEVLPERGMTAPSATMDGLWAAATAYWTRVAGDRGQYHAGALLRVRETPYESFAAIGAPDARTLYPEKCRDLSGNSFRRVTDLGRASVQQYGMAVQEALPLYLALMLVLGSHFDRDPLYPWAAAVLQETPAAESRLKARELHEAAMARLDQALSSI